MAKPDPELQAILEAAGAGGDGGQLYVPAQVVEILAIDFRVIAHPAGLALVMSCANGVQYRYPMDWTALQHVKRAVNGAKIPGVGLTSPVPPSNGGEAA